MAEDHQYTDGYADLPQTIRSVGSPVSSSASDRNSCDSGPPKKHVEASRRYRKKMKEQRKELVSKKDALVARNADLEEELQRMQADVEKYDDLKCEVTELRAVKAKYDSMMELISSAVTQLTSATPPTSQYEETTNDLTCIDNFPELNFMDVEESIERIEHDDDLVVDLLDARDQVETLTQQNQSLQQNLKKMGDEIQRLTTRLQITEVNHAAAAETAQQLHDENIRLAQSKTAMRENFIALLQQTRLTAQQLGVLSQADIQMESSSDLKFKVVSSGGIVTPQTETGTAEKNYS